MPGHAWIGNRRVEDTFVRLVGVDATSGRQSSESLKSVQERGDTDDPEPLGQEPGRKRRPSDQIKHLEE